MIWSFSMLCNCEPWIIIFLNFSRAYLKPLLRLLKKQTVTDDVMDSLVRMVVFCLQRDYILSHEKYMEMAVGNAPWPIGKMEAQKKIFLPKFHFF